MAKVADVKNQLANRASQAPAQTQHPEKMLKALINDNYKAIQSLVPKHVTPERLARLAINAATRNPKLFDCDQATLIGAIVNCAALGLEPNLIGHAYIIPFYNRKTKKMEAQFQIGYKGAIDLSRRSGELKQIYAHEVYEGDEFDYSYGLNKDLHHIPCGESNPDKVTHVYAVYHLKDGGNDFVVMNREQIEMHRDRFTKSKHEGKVTGTWIEHFVEMAKKTVIIRLLKTAPLSIERDDGNVQHLAELINTDNSISRVRESTVTSQAVIDATYAEPEPVEQEAEVIEPEPEPSEPPPVTKDDLPF
ncbi:conserved hypothetical protein [Exiguobacterium sp. 8H]|uniref:recombinase RecT n=1 Tax=unclassified Exiguobacterium TaxID=2644629 RepID=UPI0012F2A5EF|nr:MULTISPECIES: recombinase RecT [unclassified Exiguobacterium]VXB52736.1 conserved hypothetical protein [Exiguobacterium sp. 8A]VXB53374.1 conserved hypothetical protein [Exiguobacterium sp. 8H]